MRISCDRCKKPFEAADDQDLCAGCRDAAAIGDPYRATPAVLGEDAAPAAVETKVLADDGTFGYPERWGVPGLGAVIPTAFRLWKRTLGRTINLGLIAAIGSAFSIIVDCFAAIDPALGESFLATQAMLVEVLVGLPLMVICAASACFVAADELAFGRQRRGLWPIFRHASRFFWTYLGASLLMGLAVGAFLVPGAVLMVLDLKSIAVPVFAVLGLLAARLFARWSLYGEAIFFEGRSAKSALDRSRDLVIGSTWPVLGLAALQTVITSFAGSSWPYLAPYIGPIPAAIFAIAGSALGLGFGAVWSFTTYAALRDREADERALERRDLPSIRP
jgi:hypothetical protein